MGNSPAKPSCLSLAAQGQPFVAGLRAESFSGQLSADVVEFFGDDAAVPADLGADSGSVTGGGDASAYGGAILGGGATELEDYANSTYSKHNEQLIRDIASDVFAAVKLKDSGLSARAPIEEVVKTLRKYIPNPKKGQSFNKAVTQSAGNQKLIIDAAASALNKRYGAKLIDLDASPEEKCRKVSEVMGTLMRGLHVEFMAISADVLTSLKNIQTLREFVEAGYKRQQQLIKASGDSSLVDQSDSAGALYQRILTELDRQMAIISNILSSTIRPAGKELIGLLKDNKDFSGLVGDLKDDIGSTNFAKKIGYMLTGVSDIPHAASVIQKALAKLGMSVKEFKAAKGPVDLRAQIHKLIMSKNPSSQELDKLMGAADLIYKHNYNHAAVSKVIKGGEEKQALMDIFAGGADEDEERLPRYWQKKSLSKKIKDKGKFRDLILKDFRKQIRDAYAKICQSGTGIAKQIGSAIPVTDELERFIGLVKQMPNVNKENIHIALSGYSKNVADKSERERFIATFEVVAGSLDTLSKGSGGGAFRPMADAIRALIKTLDDFSDKMVNAISEIAVDRPDDVQQAVRQTVGELYGSSESDEFDYNGTYVPWLRVQQDLQYYYNIAHVKGNMNRVADELKHYGEGYEEVLGEESGHLINQITTEYNTRIDALEDGELKEKETLQSKTLKESPATAEQKKKTRRALQKLYATQRDAKIQMVETAQAVDLYLKAFTNGAVRDPDAIKDLVKALAEVPMVFNWFNEKSGDDLAALFECFPSQVDTANAAELIASGAEVLLSTGKVQKPKFDSAGNNDHYYSWLQNGSTNAAGNPTLGINISGTAPGGAKAGVGADGAADAVENILKLSGNAVSGMRALENILSIFTNVGKKVGAGDPASRTFMSAGQMYKALCNYMVASAVTTQFAPASPAAGPSSVTCLANRPLLAPQVADAGGTLIPVGDVNVRGVRMDARSYAQNGRGPAVAGVYSGVSASPVSTSPAVSANKVSSLAMASIPSNVDEWTYHSLSHRVTDGPKGFEGDGAPRVDAAGWRDDFYDTDLLFKMTIKSVVAKILTVVDAYRLFNRPVVDRDTHDSLNPLRTILGGADFAGGASKPYVKVIPEAMALYQRLPLLAEWYRDMFGFKANREADAVGRSGDWQLSLVPNIDGVWSDLVKVIFDKADYVKDGNYSEYLAQELIEAINKIWVAYKGRSKEPVRAIIDAFKMEMNRTFGFLKQKEINDYMADRRKRYASANVGTDGTDEAAHYLDYDILKANDQFTRAAAPSDKYLNVTTKQRARHTTNMDKLQKAIVDLRMKIDADFRANTVGNADQKYSFRESIRNAQNEVVLRVIQGAGRLTSVPSDKLVMLHEAIMAPLSALHRIQRVLSKFNALLHGTCLPNLQEFSDDRKKNSNGTDNIKVGEVTAPGAAAEIKTSAGFRDAYGSWLKAFKYPEAGFTKSADDKGSFDEINAFTEAFAGYRWGADDASTGYKIGDWATAKSDKGNPLQVVDTSAILRDTIGALLDLGSDPNKLVSVRVGQSGVVNVDFSGLEDLCVDMLGLVKKNCATLRQSFKDQDLFKEYLNENRAGSIPWIEEHLVQRLFRDQNKVGLSRAVSEALAKTLAHVQEGAGVSGISKVENTYNAVMEHLTYGNAAGTLPVAVTRNDLTIFPFNVLPLTKDAAVLTKEEKASLTELKSRGGLSKEDAANGILQVPAIGGFSSLDINTFASADAGGNSLMLSFNRVLSCYLADHLEPGSDKIYDKLFEGLMNGSGAAEIVQGKAFPNVVKAEKTYNEKGARLYNPASIPSRPNETSLIFESTALAIRNMATAIDSRLKKKRHTYESLADIPEFMQERMRCNLPYYSKLFSLILARARILRDLINNNKGLSGNMKTVASTAGLSSTALAGAIAIRGVEDSPACKAVALAQINHLAHLANDVRKCCDGVYKELQDSLPLFMQTSRDSIMDYKRQHGELPVMPASNVLLPTANASTNLDQLVSGDATNLLFPTGANGSARFKFNYAARLILARNDIEPTMDHIPGAKEIYNRYLGVNGAGAKVSSEEYKKTVLSLVKAARFLSDGTYTRLFAKDDRLGGTWGMQLAADDEWKKGVVAKEDWVTGARFSYNGLQLMADEAGKWQHIQGAPLQRFQIRSSSPFQGMALPIEDAKGWLVVMSSKETVAKLGTSTDAKAPGAGVALAQLTLMKGDATTFPSDAMTEQEFLAMAERKTTGAALASAETYQSRRGLVSAIDLSENPNPESARDAIAVEVNNAQGPATVTRKQLRTYNILDMSLVPINVHAFMREVPFANILNYSYTFDRMVHNFVMPSFLKSVETKLATDSSALMIKPEAPVKSPQGLLVKLLCHPWAPMGSAAEYYGLVGALFNGADNLGLRRPRYLSDQLWHKVLMTSSIQNVGQAGFGGTTAWEAQRSVINMGVSHPEQKSYDRGETIGDDVKTHHADTAKAKKIIEDVGTGVVLSDGDVLTIGDHNPVAIGKVGDFLDKMGVITKNQHMEELKLVLSEADKLRESVVGCVTMGDVEVKEEKGLKDSATASMISADVPADPKTDLGDLKNGVHNDHKDAIDAVGDELPYRGMPKSPSWVEIAPAAVANSKIATASVHALSALDKILASVGLSNSVVGVINATAAMAMSGSAVNIVAGTLQSLCIDTDHYKIASPSDRAVLAAMKATAGRLAGVGKGGSIVVAAAYVAYVVSRMGLQAAVDRLKMQLGSQDTSLQLASIPVAMTGMKVFKKDTKKWVAAGGTDLTPTKVLHLAELGRVRFDTKLVRGLVWMTNIQRVLRVLIGKHLQWVDGPVIRASQVTNQKMTEFAGNDAWDAKDYDGRGFSFF
jgi:hypothetical protein